MDNNENIIFWTAVTDEGLLIGVGTGMLIPEEYASVAVVETISQLAAQINYMSSTAIEQLGPYLKNDLE